ncbi:hypothetical protein CcaCcLH18_04447 [Colletotrichum camelliae]|nr:hypothetical protein CcaCcLH18_04447 [Colletotrichum camelliae]
MAEAAVAMTAHDEPKPPNYWEKALTAVAKLIRRDLDSTSQESLQRLSNKDSYKQLEVSAKCDLQRLAMKPKKELGQDAANRIQHIYENWSQYAGAPPNPPLEAERDSAAAEELRKICEHRQSVKSEHAKFTFRGHEYPAEQLWSSTINVLDKFKSFGDLATSSNPAAGTVWGVFKVLLSFAILGQKGQNAAIAGVTTAGNAINRGSLYERRLLALRRCEDTRERRHLDTFEKCLISLYGRIIKFFVIAANCLKKNKLTLCWYVFWEEDDILTFERDIFMHEQTIFQDASLSFMVTQDNFTSEMQPLLSTLDQRLSALAESAQTQKEASLKSDMLLEYLKNQLSSLNTLLNASGLSRARDDILDWLSTAALKDQHKTAKRHRADSTGDWVFDREEYKSWRQADESRLLWITGIPGAGKTNLISKVIDTLTNPPRLEDGHLKHTQQEAEFPEIQLAYFYCKSDDESRKFCEVIFRSYICQLAENYYPLPENIVNVYQDRHSRHSTLDPGQYLDMLKAVISPTAETILVLDALDECVGTSEEIKQVLSALKDLLATELPIKIVVSSRQSREIERSFVDRNRISITQDDNSRDIERMVRERIRSHNNESETPVTESVQQEIITVFNEKSKEMFLWASLHINHLLGLRGPQAILDELRNLPPDVTKTYEVVFERIRNLDETQRNTAFRVFQWLVASGGACDKKALLAATCQKLGPDEAEPNPVEGGDSFLLKACQNLVVVEGPVFRFAHLSVQEYYEQESASISAETGHHRMENCFLDVAEFCARFLFRRNTNKAALAHWRAFCGHHAQLVEADGQPEIDALWEYTCTQWHKLFTQIPEESQREKIRRIIDSSSLDNISGWLLVRATNMIQQWEVKNLSTGSRDDFRHAPYGNAHTVLRMALDLRSWYEPLEPWETHYLREEQESLHFNDTKCAFNPMVPVFAGLLWKMRRFIQHHLARKSWGDAESEWSKLFPIHVISKVHNARLPSISKNMVLHPQRGLIKLETSVLGRLDEVLPFIRGLQSIFEDMESGPDISYAHDCYAEVARLSLLFLCTNLRQHLELKGPIRDFSELLFQKFPRASSIKYHHLIFPSGVFDWSYDLISAARYLDHRFLAILVGHGASVDATQGGQTPLIAAISAQKQQNVEFLLQHGANVSLQLQNGSQYDSALIAACDQDNLEVLDLILNNSDVDIDAIADTSNCATALIMACRSGRIEIVKRLLRKSATVNVTVANGLYPDALSAAKHSAALRVVHLLRKHRAHELLMATIPASDSEILLHTDHQYSPWETRCETLVKWLSLLLVRGPDGRTIPVHLITTDPAGHINDNII